MSPRGTIREAINEPTRRESILAEAAALFARKGVAATSVRDIAEATGLLAGSLYHHFDSKDAIVEAILTRSLDKLLVSYRSARVSTPDPDACLTSLIRISFRVIQEEPAATTIYLKDREHLLRLPRFRYLEEARAEVDAIWLEVLHEGIEQGVFRDDFDPLPFYLYASSALWWVAGWHGASGCSIEELTDEYLAIFMRAIRADARDTGRTPPKATSRASGGEGRRPARRVAL